MRIGLEESMSFLNREGSTVVMEELLQCLHKGVHAKLLASAKATNQSLPARCDEISGPFANIYHGLFAGLIATVNEDTLSFHCYIATLDHHFALVSIQHETIDLGKGLLHTLGMHLSSLVGSSEINGVSAKEDTLVFEPAKISQVHGRIASATVSDKGLAVSFVSNKPQKTGK